MQSASNPSTLTVSGYLAEFNRVLQQVAVTDDQQVHLDVDGAADRAVQLILDVRSRGSKVLLIGNGGSAAIVSHLHNDLTKAVGARTLVFNEQPLLTALANDEGYATVFERPIAMWAESGDLLIALTSSGRSEPSELVRAKQPLRIGRAGALGFDALSVGRRGRRDWDRTRLCKSRCLRPAGCLKAVACPTGRQRDCGQRSFWIEMECSSKTCTSCTVSTMCGSSAKP